MVAFQCFEPVVFHDADNVGLQSLRLIFEAGAAFCEALRLRFRGLGAYLELSQDSRNAVDLFAAARYAGDDLLFYFGAVELLRLIGSCSVSKLASRLSKCAIVSRRRAPRVRSTKLR